MDPIRVGVVLVPASAISFKAVRARGPGGQNVNKVASKVELRVAIADIEGLEARARRRLEQLCDGLEILVSSQVSREQPRNLADARRKIEQLIARALIVPKKRRATKPSRGSVERRMKDKAHLKRKKAARKLDE